VLVDEAGEPVAAAGAPFDARTAGEAEREARDTLQSWSPSWRIVPLTHELDRKLTKAVRS
jgi:hypothetical protein